MTTNETSAHAPDCSARDHGSPIPLSSLRPKVIGLAVIKSAIFCLFMIPYSMGRKPTIDKGKEGEAIIGWWLLLVFLYLLQLASIFLAACLSADPGRSGRVWEFARSTGKKTRGCFFTITAVFLLFIIGMCMQMGDRREPFGLVFWWTVFLVPTMFVALIFFESENAYRRRLGLRPNARRPITPATPPPPEVSRKLSPELLALAQQLDALGVPHDEVLRRVAAAATAQTRPQPPPNQVELRRQMEQELAVVDASNDEPNLKRSEKQFILEEYQKKGLIQ